MRCGRRAGAGVRLRRARRRAPPSAHVRRVSLAGPLEQNRLDARAPCLPHRPRSGQGVSPRLPGKGGGLAARPGRRPLAGPRRRGWPEAPAVEGALAEDCATLGSPSSSAEGMRSRGRSTPGMRRATTEFVAVLLGDDMWAPEAVGVLNAAIGRDPGAGFFHSARMIVDEEDRPDLERPPGEESFSLTDFVRRLAGQAPPLLASRAGTLGRRDRRDARGGRHRRLGLPLDDGRGGRGVRRRAGVPLPLPRSSRLLPPDDARLRSQRAVRAQRRVRRSTGSAGCGPSAVWSRAAATRQCLYRNTLDRWVKGAARLGRAWRGRRLQYD